MTVIDCFSYWLWAIPVDNNNARETAKALLLHVYCDLAGWPAVLRSDRGEFTFDVVRELNEMLGVRQVFGSAYHPRAQSLIENTHKRLNNVSRCSWTRAPSSGR